MFAQAQAEAETIPVAGQLANAKILDHHFGEVGAHHQIGGEGLWLGLGVGLAQGFEG